MTMRTATCAILFAAFAALSGRPALAEFTLTILHTNDFHSRIEAINKYDSTCGAKDAAEGRCFGGSARLAAAIAARRKAVGEAGGHSLLVDAGDQFQGSLFYTYYKGRAAARMMNALGYEAMTVGNHEFDDGPEVLRGFMSAVAFPVVLANADVSREPALAGVLRPSVVIEKGGEKIGVIGLSPADTGAMSSSGPNVAFSAPGPALARETAALAAAGVDKIVVLSHSGYRTDLEQVATVPGVDVVVGGHTNTLLSNSRDGAQGPYPTWVEQPDGKRVPVVQAYAYGKFLGELTVTWSDAGDVVAASGEPQMMDASHVEDPEVKAEVAALAAPLKEIRDKVVAETDAPIDGSGANCRARVCEMGVLVAEAMLERVKGQGVAIALMNGGGLRASIDAGPITMGEALTVLPFQNTLSTFQLKGAHLLAALEHGVSGVEDAAGRFLQVAGLRYAWTRMRPAGEGRILSVEVREGGGWAPLDPDKIYGLVSNDFLRKGGDGFEMFRTEAIAPYDFGPNLENVVIDYLIAHAPYAPATDDRIAEK